MPKPGFGGDSGGLGGVGGGGSKGMGGRFHMNFLRSGKYQLLFLKVAASRCLRFRHGSGLRCSRL